jgi:hypothetical protein
MGAVEVEYARREGDSNRVTATPFELGSSAHKLDVESVEQQPDGGVRIETRGAPSSSMMDRVRNQDAAGRLLTIGEFALRARLTTKTCLSTTTSDCYRQSCVVRSGVELTPGPMPTCSDH